MLHILPGLHFCFACLDDILVYSISCKEYLQHLKVVYKHLKEANLKIKLSDYQYLYKHLHNLHYLISKHGIQLLPEKVSAIEKLKELSNIDKLDHFLSLTDYYRKFIPLFTDVTKPLNKLLKKDTRFQCSLHFQTVFQHL